MRPAVLASLLALCALGGCSLSRAGLSDTSALQAPDVSAQVDRHASSDRIVLHDLAWLGSREGRSTTDGALDRRALAGAFRTRIASPKSDDPDPIRGAFDTLPAEHRWTREVFLPSGGTFDLTRLGRGRLHVRAWNQDGDLHGGGLGLTVPLRSGWHASAEIGVDPTRRPGAGGVAVAVALGLGL